MSFEKRIPTEIEVQTGPFKGDKDYEHPAFGVISATRWKSSEAVRLYGSDLAHRGGITIQLSKSRQTRSLSTDRHSSTETLASFSMSETQWARFVASVGGAGDIPVTLEHYRDGEFVDAPMIAQPEVSRKELHSKEVEEEVQRVVAGFQAELKRLGELIESGKLGKKELREMHREMSISVETFPRNLGYAMDTFVRASDKVVQEAKTEIEAHVNGMATRLGMEHLRGLATVAGPGGPGPAEPAIEG